MAEQTSRRGRATITAGNPNAARTVLLFHGYTGSPGEFGDLPEILAKTTDSYVCIPLLPGHGTTEEDLLPYSFDNFIRAAEDSAMMLGERGGSFAIGGHSFGSYLAAHVASLHAPSALFLAATPYRLRFKLSFPGARYVARAKKFWNKNIDENERQARKHQFFYEKMPGIGLGMTMDGNVRITESLKNIAAPLLTLQSLNDPLAHADSGSWLAGYSKSTVRENLILNEGLHGLFYGNVRHASIAAITYFLQRHFLEAK